MTKTSLIDLTGQRFERWVVLNKDPARRITSGRFALTYWLCRCDCGSEKFVRAASLLRQKSKSCGCLRSEMYARMVTHGASNGRKAEYGVWQNMLNRCRNQNLPGYENYGGRGIKVCSRWLDNFENFFADMGPRTSSKHSLDRRDVNQGYFKKNCRWATAVEQVNNRRKIGRIDQFTEDELLTELDRRRAAANQIRRIQHVD